MKLNKNSFIPSLLAQTISAHWYPKIKSVSALLLTSAVLVAPAYAQQAGAIKGKVTDGNTSLAGVVVAAKSNVMPKVRTTTTSADGSFNLPMLIPGKYELTFTGANGVVKQLSVNVLLDQSASVNVSMSVASAEQTTEVIEITGSSILREGNSSLTNSIGADVVEGVPVGQDYRDLLKLVPGVQYSENGTLGPSAGGSGVDNKYGFDGVDVSLPMFGNLASEPSTHDVQSVSMDRGGAKAVGFNRSGGFAINTTSKSGTNDFHGSVEYKLQNKNFVSDRKDGTPYELDETWLTTSLSGPLIEDELFFYGSYYRPEEHRENKETAYGPTKDYSSIRNEYFGKLTWAPTDALLFNASLRTSDRTDKGRSIGQYETDSVSVGDKSDQDILTFDGSWLIDDYTTLSFQYGKFELKTGSQPDTSLSEVPMVGGTLNIGSLDQMGYLNVPSLLTDPKDDQQLMFNQNAQALINQYGYIGDDGNKKGGGGVGAYSQIGVNDFFRDSFELSLDHELEQGETSHTLHFGFKWSEVEEKLSRLSNGWGSIKYVGGLETASDGTPIYYQSITEQMSLRDASGATVSPIYSSAESLNIELNDTIETGDFTYNIGVLISKDVLYGQGLRAKSGTVSGFETAPGEKYKMYTVDWKDMIQPRLGVSWEYSPEDTVFANVASYNPEANSLARAASWDRNSRALLDVNFDENGQYIDSEARAGSSGKVFVENLKPRRIDELTIGTTKVMTSELFLRAHVRHRKGLHFWEDMPNNARSSGVYGNGQVPDDLKDKGDYVKNLADIRSEIGGSSYVIAEVDGGFTKYWELNLEAEYRTERVYLNGSYVWSHYYGNFDQDNTTATNDANTFIGSSNYGDGNGRYSWDNKYGTLSGDKPHLLKLYGYYTTDWEANVGAYLVYQSGQPWEKWSAEYYGYSPTSSATNRYAEPAGTRRSPSHWQMDLNYTQSFVWSDTFTVQFRADLFNVFDRQTGYDYNPYDQSPTFEEARSFYNPRRFQLSAKVEF